MATEFGKHAVYVHFNVTGADGWTDALEGAAAEFGLVDVLVNNAGAVEFGSFGRAEPESFKRVLDVNLYRLWLGMHTAAATLRPARTPMTASFDASRSRAS